MSVPTTIQSNQVPLALSTDGITYKNVVCKKSWNFNGTTAVNSEETDCGIDKGLGASDWSMDFAGVVNKTPTSSTEVSAATLAGWWVNQTLLYIKTTTGSVANDSYIQGTGYITDYGVQNSVGSLLAFTFTFNGTGTPDMSAL
jgi:hypothetical protein